MHSLRMLLLLRRSGNEDRGFTIIGALQLLSPLIEIFNPKS